MDNDHLSDISTRFGISLTDIAFLVDNFRNYAKETKITDILEFLKLRKSKYKDEIKNNDLKNKLRVGIENYIKSPFKILKKIFSNEKSYNEFILSLDEDRKNKNKIRKKVPNQLSSFWTDEEIAKLKSNFNNVIEKYNIEDPRDFLLDTSKENTKFKININLSKLLAEGIPDHKPYNAYKKLKSMQTESSKMKWNEDEIDKLMKLAIQFKPNWSLVGKELNRTAEECRVKYRDNNIPLGYTKNTGPWKKSECKRLRKAVRKLMNVPKYTFVIENIPWAKVTQFVKTRNSVDCRLHWIYTFSCIKQDGVRSHFNDDIFFNFIKKIKKTKVRIWKSIDWKSLWIKYDKGQFSPSPAALVNIMRTYLKKFASLNPKYGMKLKKLYKRLDIENNTKINQKQDDTN